MPLIDGDCGGMASYGADQADAESVDAIPCISATLRATVIRDRTLGWALVLVADPHLSPPDMSREPRGLLRPGYRCMYEDLSVALAATQPRPAPLAPVGEIDDKCNWLQSRRKMRASVGDDFGDWYGS